MKKSVITLLTLVLVLVNLVLTALLTFTIMPETKKANELITKVADAIDLDLSAGQSTSGSNTSLETTEAYTLADDMTITLSDGGVALIKPVININKESDGYKAKTYTKDTMSTYDGVIQKAVTDVVSQYSAENFNEKKQDIQDQIKDELANSFGGDVVSAVGFAKAVIQPKQN